MKIKSMAFWVLALLAVNVLSCRSEANERIPVPTMPADLGSLTVLLHDSDLNLRWMAACTLGNLGPDAAPAVPDLVQALSDEREVRGCAATALSKIGPAAAPAVPKLMAMLGEDWHGSRSDAAQALGSIGAQARAAVPALETVLLTDPDQYVRIYAAEALGKIGEPEAIDALQKAVVGDKDKVTRRYAALALAKFGEAAKSTVPALAPLLWDKEDAVQRAAAFAIAHIVKEPFPDSEGDGNGFTLDKDGNAKIVVAARQWWEARGKYQTW